jgi:hypothetical protein
MRYYVEWRDPRNSVQRKGAVEHNGKTVFRTLEEARSALLADKQEELDYNPNSLMTWAILELREPN